MRHESDLDLLDGKFGGGQEMALFGDHVVRLVKLADLGARDRAQWADLTARAGDTNIFAQDWFMEVALRHAPPDQPIQLAIVERQSAGWIGVVPLFPRPRCGRWPSPNWQTWLATNQFLGAPLVAQGEARHFWALLLRFLDGRAGREIFLQCREMAWDGPVCRGLVNHCAQAGRKLHIVKQWDRPARIPVSGEQRPTGKSRAKALGRIKSLQRRLDAECGPVVLSFYDSTSCAQQWIEAFLNLERAGWKGRGGSALACDSATEGLFRDVMAAARLRGHLRCATLSVADKPLAMSSWFVAEDRSYGFKMAYDEDYRSYAPGQILMRHIADHVAANPALHFDSCTSAGVGGSRAIWPDTRTIVDCTVGIGSPLRRAAFGGMMVAKSAHRAVTGG